MKITWVKRMNIITIDCGASFLKAALFQDNKIVREIHRKAPKVHGSEDIFCPTQIHSLLEQVKSVLREMSDGLTEAVVSISNEMHGFLLAYEDGTPYTDYISWQKEFGAELLDGIASKTILEQPEYAGEILRSGMPVRSGLPSSNLLYLKRSGALNGKKDTLYFYTLGDYIVRSITGKQPVCHVTNAAASGLMNLETGEWNSILLKLVCDNAVKFPLIGTDCVDTILENCTLHFLSAIGDQQAALYGAGVVRETDLSFNLGTGAQVSKIVSQPVFSEKYQTRPYMNGTFIKSVPHLPSGRAMNVYIRFIQDILSNFEVKMNEDKIWDCVLRAVEAEDETSLDCDLSFFENPITDHVTGSISNIPEYGLKLGSLFRAIFDRMADNFLVAAQVIEPEVSRVERLVFSGGVSKRISYIRDEIQACYAGVSTEIAVDNETLYGLNKYANFFIN